MQPEQLWKKLVEWRNVSGQMKETSVYQHTPIALVGGGLTTQVLALSLVHSGFEFIWFSGAQDNQTEAEDPRTTTIHHAGRMMLGALGIWNSLPEPACPVTQIAVAGAQHAMDNKRDRPKDWPLCWEQADPPMAWVLSNQNLRTACSAEIDIRLCKQQMRPVSIETVTISQPNLLHDNNGKTWSCDLLIACDGANSRLRKQAGLSVIDQSRGETAIVTTVHTERPIGRTAYQRFLPSGPLAIMPTGAKTASVVWSLPDRQAAALIKQDGNKFADTLNAAFGNNLGRLTPASAYLSWPLKPSFCPRITKSGFILAGDAAHALHPLAGMGFNLALADVAVLLDCLQNAACKGLTPSHASVTAAYEARRKAEILTLTSVTQGLNRLLTRKPGQLYQLACIGMSVLGQVPARQLLSRLAMGGTLATAPLFSGQLTASDSN